MTELFINWQNERTRNWHVVGKLWRERGLYHFGYTKGVRQADGFVQFGRMLDLNAVYTSQELFPFLANRILSRGRPEYQDYLRWMDIRPGDETDLLILSRSGGERGTDSLQVFAAPQRDETGVLVTHFFVHSLRHLHPDIARHAAELQVGDRLLPMLDVCNPVDANAVALRTEMPSLMMGYVPRYLARDMSAILKDDPGHVDIRIARLNEDAPIQMRLLCSARLRVSESFMPCCGEEFQLMHEASGRSGADQRSDAA